MTIRDPHWRRLFTPPEDSAPGTRVGSAPRILWTEEEQATLRRHWPEGGYARCRELLPHRTEWQMRGKAHALGLRYRRGRKPRV